MARAPFLIAVLGTVGFYAVLILLFRPFVADDAYIVGRYAENVVRGHGLVYNAGEFVTALTSPLHALVLTAIAFLSDSPVAVYRVLGAVLPLLGWGLAVWIYRPSRAEIAVVSLVGLASPFLVLWAGGGLETPILSALLTVFAAVLFKVARRGAAGPLDFLTAGALAGFAFLTRFDSIIVTLPPMLAVALIMWRRPALWAGAALALVIAASWLVFSFLYYGDILPTSAYIKLSAHATMPVDNIAALANMVLVSGLVVWGLVALIPRSAEHSVLSKAIGRGAAVSVIGFVYYAYTSAGVHMMFGFRFFVPVLVVASMLIAARVRDLGRALVPLLVLQGAVQGAVAAAMLTLGMNVYVINDFGPLGSLLQEYRRTTPREYGHMMAILEKDAADLNAHWSAEGLDTVPHIYLYTGGMGYWLPEFYVFETLASYRHNCGYNLDRVLATTHYVQDLSIGANTHVREVYDRVYRASAPVRLSDSDFHTDAHWRIYYKYNTPFEQVVLPKQIGGPC